MQNKPGPLLEHLPAIYHASEDLSALLSAMEEVLFGPGQSGTEGLEQEIAAIPSLFNPGPDDRARLGAQRLSTLAKFLPWLAQWVALSRYQGMPKDRLRELISEIVPLYAKRGTKQYLKEMLQHFIPELAITIDDQELPSLRVGRSKLGSDSWLGGDRPYWFLVSVHAGVSGGREELESMKEEYEDKIRSVVNLAKPAHTIYQLQWEFDAKRDTPMSTQEGDSNA